MRLWISRDSATPIHEQLGAQMLLGILSGTYTPGQRLPSVRQLARRLRIHANTVSSVYRDLARRGWVAPRTGSGVFVAHPAASALATVDGFADTWVQAAAARGITVAQLRDALDRRDSGKASVAKPALVVDLELELAEILAAELSEIEGRSFSFAAFDDQAIALAPNHDVWSSSGRTAEAARFLGPDIVVRPIPLRSIDELVSGQRRPGGAVLIGIVSGSAALRTWAGLLLAALGIPAEAVILRDPRAANSVDGLDRCDILAADIVAARGLPASLAARPLRIVAAANCGSG